MSHVVMSIGSACFGATIGYITYRTLVRADKASINDLTTVIATIGGAAVTGIFDPAHGDLFGWYAIGLLIGLFGYISLFRAFTSNKETAEVLSGKDISAGR